MEITTEEHAREALAAWREVSVTVQRLEIRLAVEKLELNQMYYEQKGREEAAARTERCIRLLKDYLTDIE
ncbi:MAG: hypothetical protein KKC20_15320 [Proteobacteria bacterium]|nr:hypothetical protein [Pseudomonadota bacterium]